MVERRPLVEGLKSRSGADRVLEEHFVYGEKPQATPARPQARIDPAAHKVTPVITRVPLTSRLRTDLADALKRASLERQLQRIEPNTVQDILEGALEPWLRANGYLP